MEINNKYSMPVYEKMGANILRQYPLLPKALQLIRIAHHRQFYNGQPYFHHPIRVSLRMNFFEVEPPVLYAALFHDLLEDTAVTAQDLLDYGFDFHTVSYVSNLTRDEESSYKEYIAKILSTGDYNIIRIKLCDLYENSNNVRFLAPEKRSVLVRYGKSLKEIQEYLTRSEKGLKLLNETISGPLDKETLGIWLGQEPTFL